MNKIKLRRLKKNLSNKKVKILLISIISLFLLMGTGYAILSTRLDINGSAKIVAEESTCDLNITGDLTINTSWGGGDGTTVYNATLTINNNSDEDIIGWTIKMKGPSDLIVQANANITVDENGVSTLTDMGWNGTLNPGGSLQLDLGLITVETELNMEYIIFNGCKIYGSGEVEPDPSVELKSLQISPSEYTMTIGETAPLQVTKTPSNAEATLTWTSSNESVVSVTSDGVITALSNGTAIITVSSGSISATSTIIVSGLTALSLSPSEYTMKVGDTYTLTVTKTPINAEATLIWSSSDSSVVSVTDSGLITALKEGSATITVSSDGISATSSITVSGLTALALSPSVYSMKVGDTYTLNVTKTPADAEATLTWTSSDSSVVSVTNSGLITALKEGSATITVSSGGISATSTITVTSNETPSSDGLDIEFSSPYYYERDIQFKFVVTNNSDSKVESFSFDIGVPDGTTYSLWTNPGVTAVGNTFDVTLQWVTLNPGESIQITGNMTLPEGYSGSDYLNPTITNIKIK